MASEPSTPLKRGFLPELLGYNLGQARAALWRDLAKSDEPPMRSGQFTALVLLHENPGIAQVQLGRELGLDKATIVSLIDRLAGSGFVERRAAPNDRRRHALYVTKRGAKAVGELRQSRMAHEQKFRDAFSSDELTSLFGFLQRLAAIES